MTTLLIYWGGPLLRGWGIKGQHTEVSSPLWARTEVVRLSSTCGGISLAPFSFTLIKTKIEHYILKGKA